jgi:hypothetical protein
MIEADDEREAALLERYIHEYGTITESKLMQRDRTHDGVVGVVWNPDVHELGCDSYITSTVDDCSCGAQSPTPPSMRWIGRSGHINESAHVTAAMNCDGAGI